MTFKEKWVQEHPNQEFDPYEILCPSEYGYEAQSGDDKCEHKDLECRQCWDREMPEEKIQGQRVELPLIESDGVPKEIVDEVCTPLDTPQILDSGDCTQFETGAVRDMREGKGRCDLMPLEVVAEYFRRGMYAPDPKRSEDYYWILHNIEEFKNSNFTWTDPLYHALSVFEARFYDYTPTTFLEVAKHFEEGAKKYGENNWQKGIPPKCYIDSAVRHFLKLARGDDDEPHDRAFVWNLMCCIWEVDYHKTTVEAVENNDAC